MALKECNPCRGKGTVASLCVRSLLQNVYFGLICYCYFYKFEELVSLKIFPCNHAWAAFHQSTSVRFATGSKKIESNGMKYQQRKNNSYNFLFL